MDPPKVYGKVQFFQPVLFLKRQDMTIKQLKELLSKYDEDMHVSIKVSNRDGDSIGQLDTYTEWDIGGFADVSGNSLILRSTI